MLLKLNRFFKVVQYCKRTYCEGGFPPTITNWLEEMCELLYPKTMHIWDGSLEEREAVIQELVSNKVLIKMKQQNNCFVCKSDPHDNGRDDSRVFTAAYSRSEYIPNTHECTESSMLGNVMPMGQAEEALNSRFTKVMKGKKMYVIPFVLGPLTCDIKIIGLQVTDSPLVALLTGMIVRTGAEAQAEMHRLLGGDSSVCNHKFLKLIHSAGCEPGNPPNWPSNREKYIIVNMPEKGEIWSYGSTHWDNSLLVKKGAALQLASLIGRKERFIPANMSVLTLQDSCGSKNIGILGPPGSGRSVFAAQNGKGGNCPVTVKMMIDDIAWLRVNSNTGCLHAINPEIGIFPLVRGVSTLNTPHMMAAVCSNTLIMNTGTSGEDSAWWEGLDLPDKDTNDIKNWQGKPWLPDGPRAAHLDARFCTNINNMSNLDPQWESSNGIPLSAIVILTRRSEGFPLVMEIPTWSQGILHATAIRTRYHTTPLDSDELAWEPFGMRQYLGYNLGKMFDTWLCMSSGKNVHLPRIFLVNLFLLDNDSKRFLWPGYELNHIVIGWILKRLKDLADSEPCPIGYLPTCSDLELPDDFPHDFDSLVFYSQEFWQEELDKFLCLLRMQMPEDISKDLCKEFQELKMRVSPPVCEDTAS